MVLLNSEEGIFLFILIAFLAFIILNRLLLKHKFDPWGVIGIAFMLIGILFFMISIGNLINEITSALFLLISGLIFYFIKKRKI